MRRLRSSASLRGLVRETDLRAGQLVLPLFVTADPSSGPRRRARADRRDARGRAPGAVGGRRGCARGGELGIGAVMLFGIPGAKDEHGSGAWDEEGVVQLAVRAIKRAVPELP